MSSFSEVHGDAEFASGHSETGHVVRMLVSDNYCVEGSRVFVDELHTAKKFAAAQAGVHQNPSLAAGHNSAVAFRPRCKHCEPDHVLRIPLRAVYNEVVG